MKGSIMQLIHGAQSKIAYPKIRMVANPGGLTNKLDSQVNWIAPQTCHPNT
jgi:hypothetical protein